MACDTFWVITIPSKFQVPSLYGFVVKVFPSSHLSKTLKSCLFVTKDLISHSYISFLLKIFTETPQGRFSLVVTMSVFLSVCVSVLIDQLSFMPKRLESSIRKYLFFKESNKVSKSQGTPKPHDRFKSLRSLIVLHVLILPLTGFSSV